MLLQDTSANFGDRLQQSFTQVFGDIVPALLGALVILFAGYLLAKVLEKLVERFLRRIRLNRMLERGGVMQAVERSGSHLNPIRVLTNLVFWLVMFAVILGGIGRGGFVGGLSGASAGALHGGRALARVGRGGVILLAIFMALQE